MLFPQHILFIFLLFLLYCFKYEIMVIKLLSIFRAKWKEIPMQGPSSDALDRRQGVNTIGETNITEGLRKSAKVMEVE